MAMLKKKKTTFSQTSSFVGRAEMEVEEGIGVINVGGGRIDLHGEHTTSCIGDVLRNCAPETCIILLASITPINSIKRKINK